MSTDGQSDRIRVDLGGIEGEIELGVSPTGAEPRVRIFASVGPTSVVLGMTSDEARKMAQALMREAGPGPKGKG